MRHPRQDGPLRERLALHRRVIRAGGDLRWPFRLPTAPGSHPAQQVSVGHGTYVGPHAWLNLVTRASRIDIGAGTAIGSYLTIGCSSRVDVGPGCVFSDRVTLVDHLHDADAWVREAVQAEREPHFDWRITDGRPVAVGAGTWIGIGVVVLPGVRIGAGCVIGANSVVSRDVPDRTVAAGVPARVIRPVGVVP